MKMVMMLLTFSGLCSYSDIMKRRELSVKTGYVRRQIGKGQNNVYH